MATSNGERYKARKPRGLVARAWSESCDEIEVPGSPKTPRTSTTPGTIHEILLESKKIKNYIFFTQIFFYLGKFTIQF